MAMEPINLFGRELDRPAVARRMREITPKVELDAPYDDGWRELTATFGPIWNRKRLTIRYDPDYCSEPNWSRQLEGMRGYFSRFPETPRKVRALMLTHTFKFSLATDFRPDAARMDDPRVQALLAVAEVLDGVLITPSALLDARGRVLFGADGAAMEDPGARWPRVIYEVEVDAARAPAGAHSARAPVSADADEEHDPDPAATAPDAARVAVRALALAALADRAFLDDEPDRRSLSERHGGLVSWARKAGAEAEMEPEERAVLLAPPGTLEPGQQANATWRLEGLGVLLWALNRGDIPPHDQEAHAQTLFETAGVLRADAARELLAAPALRPRDEIAALRMRLFALNWRITEYHISRQVMDFARFAATAWFGPLDITGLPLVEGDLAIGGMRIDVTPPRELARTRSIVHERHLAANWLWEGPELYSRTDVST
jgi:hypothetical protein